MEILPDIEIVDLALRVKNYLIIGDLHLGYEEAMNKQGVLIPRFQFKDTCERINKIVKKLDGKVNNIILNGDIKHEFGRILETEWRDVRNLVTFLRTKFENIILIKGNHDKLTEIIAEKENLEVYDHYQIDKTTILHGDYIPPVTFKDVDNIIIGHEHIAVSLRESSASEKFKAFIMGKYQRKNLIAMPSFNTVTIGTDVTKERLLSPFLQHDLDNFEVFIVEDKEYYFGKIKDL